MIDNQVNTPVSVNADADLLIIPNTHLTAANDVEWMDSDINSMGAVEPLKGGLLAYTIPALITVPYICRVDYGGATAQHRLSLFNSAGVLLQTIAGVTGANITDVMNLFVTQFAAYNYQITFTTNGIYAKVTILVNGQNSNLTAAWRINDLYNTCVTLQYGIPNDANDLPFIQIGAVVNNDIAICFNSDPYFFTSEIGIAKKSGGTWTYTRILRSQILNFPIGATPNDTTELLDARMEVNGNNEYAVYFTDNTNKPRVIYIPTAYSTDCVLKYTPTTWIAATDGYIVLGFEDKQLNLQLINNEGLVEYTDQIQNGGALLSGGYRYAVRFGLNGSTNTTEWTFLTPNETPVYSASTTGGGGYFSVQGERAGEATGKINILTVKYAQQFVFGYVELAALHSAGNSGNSGTIVGRFDITSDEFDIQHTGLEGNVQILDVATLPQSMPVILKSKRLETKKGRLNLANIELAVDDAAYATIASAASTGNTIYSMDVVAGTIAEDTGTLRASVGTLEYPDMQNSSGSLSSNAWNGGVTLDGAFAFRIRHFLVTAPFSNPFSEWNSPAPADRWTNSSGAPVTVGVHVQVDTNRISSTYFGLYIVNNAGTNLAEVGYLKQVETSDGTIQTNFGDSTTFNAYFTVPAGDSLALWIKGSTNENYGLDLSSIFQVTLTPSLASIPVAEYQLPLNCSRFVGYTIDETYAIYLKFHMKDGSISAPHYVGTRLINKPVTMAAGDLWSSYIYALSLSGINIESVRTSIVGISVWRAICNPTILGSGVYMSADEMESNGYVVGRYPTIQYPLVPNTYDSYVSATARERKNGIFISADTRNNKIQPNTGDIIKIWGAPTILQSNQNLQGGNQRGAYVEYNGDMPSLTQVEHNVLDGTYQDFNTTSRAYKNGPDFSTMNLQVSQGCNASLAGVGVTLGTFVTAGANDNGIYNAQYKITLANQYDPTFTRVVPTGYYLAINETIPIGNISIPLIFGGDTYTQKSIIKVMYWGTANDVNVPETGFITHYGQNKINTQLFYNDNTKPRDTWNLNALPTLMEYLFSVTAQTDVVEEQFNYDGGYSADYPFFSSPYDSRLTYSPNYPARIMYSSQKPIGSFLDFYRSVAALDFRDLDLKNGEIVALLDINDVMMAWQPRAVTVLPYQSDVPLAASDGSLYVGSGGVYNQRENIVSTYGASVGSAVLSGKNRNGNSQAYWVSHEASKVLRYGYDGVKSLSDDNSFRNYLLNNLPKTSSESLTQMGFDVEKQMIYVSSLDASSPFTITFGEKTNDFKGTITPICYRYFPYLGSLIAPNAYPNVYTGQVLELFADPSNYLMWWTGTGNAVIGVFALDYIVNKNPMISKRGISVALNVGEAHNESNNPTLIVSTALGATSTISAGDFQLRNGELVASIRDFGNVPISGQWIKISITSQLYFRLLNMVTKFRTKFRTVFR